MSLEVIWTATHPDAVRPDKAHDDDAGFDLVCIEDKGVEARSSVLVRTGVAIAMPPGWWGRIVGRSSAWHRRNFVVVEGVIDAGFRGELFVGLWNPHDLPKMVVKGEKLAQLLFLPVPSVHWVERPELPTSKRGDNGFGSTG